MFIYDTVIAEAVYVLSSKRLYNQPREEIWLHLEGLLRLKGVMVSNRRILFRALDIYTSTNLDIVDALLAGYCLDTKQPVVSFDADYDRVEGVTRHEP